MSLRRFLAEQRVASRAAVIPAVLFVAGAIAGCSSTVNQKEIELDVAYPGLEAATITEARTIDLSDEINRLRREQSELEGRRSDCLDQAAYYLVQSAAVWSDPSVSERERPIQAGQFTTLAEESQLQADRYGEMAQACGTRIAQLQARRENKMKQAEEYESLVVPVHASE